MREDIISLVVSRKDEEMESFLGNLDMIYQ